jgi:hypothetical protein
MLPIEINKLLIKDIERSNFMLLFVDVTCYRIDKITPHSRKYQCFCELRGIFVEVYMYLTK